MMYFHLVIILLNCPAVNVHLNLKNFCFNMTLSNFFSLFYFLKFYFILSFLIYNIVLFLPHINMNLPQVYTCSQSRTPNTIPLGHPSTPAPSILHPASNLDWWFISYMILYMFQWHSSKSSHPLPRPQNQKVLYICVSFAVLHTGLSLPSF